MEHFRHAKGKKNVCCLFEFISLFIYLPNNSKQTNPNIKTSLARVKGSPFANSGGAILCVSKFVCMVISFFIVCCSFFYCLLFFVFACFLPYKKHALIVFHTPEFH
jgi:hypothetical protein